MSYLWVKYLETRPVKINVKDCEDIDDLIELVNAKLQLETPPQNITIHLSNDTSSPSLHPGLALSDISKQPGFESNSDEHPLIVRTLSSLSGMLEMFKESTIIMLITNF